GQPVYRSSGGRRIIGETVCESAATAERRCLGPRDQARRLPPHRAQGWRASAALQPPRQRPYLPLPADRPGGPPPTLALVYHRRRGRVLRRGRHAELRPYPVSAA